MNERDLPPYTYTVRGAIGQRKSHHDYTHAVVAIDEKDGKAYVWSWHKSEAAAVKTINARRYMINPRIETTVKF